METTTQPNQPQSNPMLLMDAYSETIADFKNKVGMDGGYDSTDDVPALLLLAQSMMWELAKLLSAAHDAASPDDKGYSWEAHATTHWSWLHADIARTHLAIGILANDLHDVQQRAEYITEAYGKEKAQAA